MRKIILVGILVGLIIVGVVLFFVLRKDKNGVPLTNQTQEPTKESSLSPSKSVTVLPTIPAYTGDTQTYTSSYFGFSYPSSLNITEGIADEEGYTVVVNAPPSFSPVFRVVVQENPQDKVSVQKIKNALALFGLTPTDITVGSNIQATLYTNAANSNRQQLVTLIQQGGYVYRIDLSYPGTEKNQQIEGYYMKIVTTFVPQ